MRARDQSSIFSTGRKFRPDYGLLLELHALTLVTYSYALLAIPLSCLCEVLLYVCSLLVLCINQRDKWCIHVVPTLPHWYDFSSLLKQSWAGVGPWEEVVLHQQGSRALFYSVEHI